MPRRLITSPTFLDLQRINLSSPDLIIATAFYSRAALNVLQGSPKRLRLYFRLDLSDPSEWIQGSIAPDALLDTANRLAAGGTEVGIFVNPGAHAKLYIGTAAAMVGSANLTLRAFSGSPELLYEIVDARERKQLEAEAEQYFRLFERTDIARLQRYVDKYRDSVKRAQRTQKITLQEDFVAPVKRDGLPRFGSYDHFLEWLERRDDDAAWAIVARARRRDLRRGEKLFRHSQLSGHVWRSFYGLRQYLLAYPSELDRLQKCNPEVYKLLPDAVARPLLREFISSHAVDEPAFSLSTWKNYVPIRLGGKAEKNGGAIGSLNMMVPLVAQYLAEQQQ